MGFEEDVLKNRAVLVGLKGNRFYSFYTERPKRLYSATRISSFWYIDDNLTHIDSDVIPGRRS